MQNFTLTRKMVIASMLLVLIGIFAFHTKEPVVYFSVKNNLNRARTSETISIPVSKINKLVKAFGAAQLQIKDVTTDSVLVSQPLDNNGDGTIDEILFQINIPANAEKKFSVSGRQPGAAAPRSKLTTYARFVPERTDDFAWENDRVAFRTYGPVAQQLVEQNKPGGTLTSGIDAWLKRVNYPIIDKWYRNNSTQGGSYHVDHGEGYDPYQVGPSRGVGGIGVFLNDSLYVSKNFVQYKILATGPIRTLFELTYAPWQAGNSIIQEKKRISLDLGSNLTRYEVTLRSNQTLPNVTVGIALHDKKGEVKVNPSQGWFRYWEPMDDAFLGTGIVVSPAAVQQYKDWRVKAKDHSQLLVITKPQKNTIVYYAGFGWTKSENFKNQAEWDAYLQTFAQCKASPLQLTLKK
ncbi:DUF4861 domain-containing protein [Adhaeribacter swui]|uniref:DUF4861 domain-containing protein n=1 Tax=Adhaeribacter swui TaxID=2086471 RepID=A0A7G7G527_9BACT|nr:DUF4861 domain-containing protein [Adhaeribacter swui]QNF32261.1 DUF4861 domain-containing protein [Adhaeribacter swui]